MRKSLHLGTFAAIAVYMHWTFLLLLAWPLVAAFCAWQGPHEAALNLLLVIGLLSCVLLHELGHAFVARSFGVPTLDATLLPFGGVARLVRKPDTPGQELLIATAGPTVNVAIAALLYTIVTLTSGDMGATGLAASGGFVAKLMWLNLALAVLNILPVPPLDGARVLRAVAALLDRNCRATSVTATVGR